MEGPDRSRGLLCLFSKLPEPGRVKTRLARGLGVERTTALAWAFLEDTFGGLLQHGVDVVLAVDAEPATRPVFLSSAAVWLQGEGDLGERLERVCRRALERYGWVVVVGSDSPGCPPEYRQAAMRELERPSGADAVLGPTSDGGYYLIGLRRIVAGMLRGVRWSSEHAFGDTRANLMRSGLTVSEIEPWFDVDEPEDLDRLGALLERGAIHAPRTQALLAEWRAEAPNQRAAAYQRARR